MVRSALQRDIDPFRKRLACFLVIIFFMTPHILSLFVIGSVKICRTCQRRSMMARLTAIRAMNEHLQAAGESHCASKGHGMMSQPENPDGWQPIV